CIRNQSTQQFKAAQNINAQKRCCVTGTPIQNSIQDLRSLLAFLYFHPYSEPVFFCKYIVGPLSSQGPDPFQHLRPLLSVVCFRRTRVFLSMPPSDVHEVSVVRTTDEAQRYDEVLKSAKLEYESIANMKSTKKKFAVLLETVMKLRRLCRHGTNTTKPRVQNSKPSSKKRKRADVAFWNYCEDCCDGNINSGLDTALREHCPTCSDSFPPDPSSTHQWTSNAPLLAVPLHSYLRINKQFQIYLQGVTEKELSSLPRSLLLSATWRIRRKAIKSYRRGIPHLRIDGSTNSPDRQVILSKFSEDPNQCVLLMSINTGAVGYVFFFFYYS
ncbi:hypothetical protein M426DRAFT_67968, partial [Hypoxylon sp. CI-4A]